VNGRVYESGRQSARASRPREHSPFCGSVEGPAAGRGHRTSHSESFREQSGPRATLELEKYERLAQARLQRPLRLLFSELTGLRLLVAWAPPPPLSWSSILPLCRTARCKRLCASARARLHCRRFEEECLKQVLDSETRGHEFICPFGVRSFWLPIVLADLCLGIVFIQMPADLRAGHSSSLKGRHSRVAKEHRRRSTDGRHRFKLAKGLLQLIADDLAQTALARAERLDLDRLSKDVTAHEGLETNLRRALHKLLPFVAVKPAALACESHADQIAHQMLDYIGQCYRQPIGLEAFATRAGMNAAYLSTLFSKTVGLPFRSYLKELRLEKAQALLSDPLRRISETAYAVGYTDPNRFRLDFKEYTGLSPSAWREALAAGS